ncbi:MAG: GntR family transcriptional regulator, partial [Chitinivibrionales bacterium]|nr:GntR family transcriptional regulator [Chitinivibrionales bacterium]
MLMLVCRGIRQRACTNLTGGVMDNSDARTGRRQPARARARAFLLERIRSATRRGETRLPTVAALAGGAGVSPVTMLHAVRALRDEGVLAVSHGKGIRLIAGAAPSEPAPREPRQPRWREVLARLEQDIIDGRYDSEGVLPTPKQMRHRYGVSHRTLLRALERLVHDGTIAPYRRTYRVRMSSGSSGVRKRVLYVASAGSAGLVSTTTVRSQELYLALERECAQRGLRLEPRPAYHQRIESFRLSDPSSVLGAIVSPIGLGEDAFGRVLSRLPPLPTGVVVTVADGRYRRVARGGGRVKIFSMANSRLPGQVMGTYLRNLGHSHIAYL